MNIFEALEKGNGKATIGAHNLAYVYYENGRFAWHSFGNPNYLISLRDLRCDDWIPYVPRGTCSNCGFPSYPGRMVKLTPDYKCVECGRGDIFEVVPPPKTKYKEVFEEVNWIIDSEQVAREKVATIYPHITKLPLAFNKFAWKKTKMTLEWEE